MQNFFCSRDFVDRSHIKIIFLALAYQLGCHFPSFREHLVPARRTRPDIGSKATANPLTERLINPLIVSGISTTLAIEGLDESKDSGPTSLIFSLLARVIDDLPDIKFLVTGRSEAPIRASFRIPSFKPHTASWDQLSRRSRYFPVSRCSSTGHCQAWKWFWGEVSRMWLSADKLMILVQRNARNFFCFRLYLTQAWSWRQPLSAIHSTKERIHALQQRSSPMARLEESYDQLRSILGTTILAYNALSLKSLSELLQLPSSNMIKTRRSGPPFSSYDPTIRLRSYTSPPQIFLQFSHQSSKVFGWAILYWS